MKNLRLTLVLTACVAVLTSCSHAPKACFTVSVFNSAGTIVNSSKGNVGESFYFSPMCSKKVFRGATLFDYGDGTTGGIDSHVYSKPGSYTVKCTVYSADGKSKGDKTDIASQTVTVTALQAEATQAGQISKIN